MIDSIELLFTNLKALIQIVKAQKQISAPESEAYERVLKKLKFEGFDVSDFADNLTDEVLKDPFFQLKKNEIKNV